MDDVYVTSDFPELVYLVMKNARVRRVEKSPSGRVDFEFDDRERCEKLSNEFSFSEEGRQLERHLMAAKQVKRKILLAK